MTKEELLEKIAPCSLLCHTCRAYKDGVICKAANQLSEYLDGMLEFNEKRHPGEVANYIIFEDELHKTGAGKCSGCRSKEHNCCSIKGCFLLECTKEHSVDFCGECAEFPCDKTKPIFDQEIYLQWVEGNCEIMQEGIDAFWENHCTKSHYSPYKKKGTPN